MSEYKIEVKAWMLKKSTDTFTFMRDKNNDIPMPLMVMYGTKIGEAPKMIKVKLHGDIKQRIINRCMHCGKVITNPVSQYFGMGPKCGGHNYTNPFASEEELNKAVASYRERLSKITWIGWIPYSAILNIDDSTDIVGKVNEMPFEVVPESEYLFSDNGTSTKSILTVKARVDKPTRGTSDYSVYLTFRYNSSLISAIKDFRPGTRFWNPETKIWELDYKLLDALRTKFPEFEFDVENEDIIPNVIDISDDYDFKTKPMEHQVEGVQYGLEHNRWFLGDQQGTGKTKTIIDLATIRKKTEDMKHCLIICCVNSLKWNWMEEIEKHSNESGWILGMRKKKRTNAWTVGSNKDKLDDIELLINGDPEMDKHFFIITNIESLRNTEIADKLAELCSSGVIGMVAADECHRCKDTRNQQTTGLLKIQPTYRVAMSGTPLVNTPLDLFAILKWLGYQKYGFMSFREHFCYTDEWGGVIGYKNIDQLEGQLDDIMLRRTKEEVLDLPEKVYINEYVELTTEQKDLYNQVIDAIIEDDEIAEQLNLECQLAVKTRLRQVSGGIEPFNKIKKNPKLDRMEELVEEAVYSGTKVIIFSNWVKELNPAIERLQKYNPVVISGEVDPVERQNAIHKFQNDDSVKVILCTVAAAGVGITLTAASEVIFLDEPWTNADKEQAIDRAHRIGTKSAVTIHTIMGHNTYDEHVHQIVLGKRDLSDAIIDKNALAKLRIA